MELLFVVVMVLWWIAIRKRKEAEQQIRILRIDELLRSQQDAAQHVGWVVYMRNGQRVVLGAARDESDAMRAAIEKHVDIRYIDRLVEE